MGKKKGTKKGSKKSTQKAAVASNAAPSEALTHSIGNMSLTQDTQASHAFDGNMSSSERLPVELRKEILRYLLLSDRVRQPLNKYGVRDYSFQPAVLRVNRRLSIEAKSILYGENAFVRVTFHRQPGGSDSMTNHEVAFLQNGNMSRFDKHVVSIDIRPDRLSPLRDRDNHFLLMKQDVPKFTRYLRIMDIGNPLFYHFKFEVCSTFSGGTLSLSDQKAIREPFKIVTGTELIQTVAITGNADETVVKNVSQATTQKCQWARAGAWELFNIAASMKAVGDELWRAGFTDIAVTKWNDVSAWISQSVQENELLLHIDPKADMAGLRIHLTCDLDRALWDMSNRGKFSSVGKRDFKDVLELCEPGDFQRMTEKGSEVTAELGLNRPNKAAKKFANAVKLNPQNDKYRAGYKVARGWASATEIQRKDRLQSLPDDLPEPFPLEDWKAHGTAEVESEKYCLRKLGFKGDFPLDDKIEGYITVGMTGHGGLHVCTLGYVKYSKMEEYLRRARKQQQGLLSNRLFWVRLDLSQLGEGIPGCHYPEDQGE